MAGAGKTQNQAHSRPAFGYFRSRASIRQGYPFGLAVAEILVENQTHSVQMTQQFLFQRFGQHGDPVLVSFAGANCQGPPFEIEILGAQVGALLKPQPAAVNQFGHQ